MNAYFVFAALIAFLLGIVHSYMGEKYLVSPILRSEHLISALSGSIGLKKVALRVCWHFCDNRDVGDCNHACFSLILTSQSHFPGCSKNNFADLRCLYG